MFFEKNKHILLGAAAVIVAWVIVRYWFVQENWDRAQAATTSALEIGKSVETTASTAGKGKLSKNDEAQLLPRKKAEELLTENNASLEARLRELKRIEFGTQESLKTFSEAAAGANDPKNYLSIQVKQTADKARANNITVPPELNILEKASDDPVPLSLIRVAMADRFITACKDASIPQIAKFQYFPGQPVPLPESDAPQEEEKEKTRGVRSKENETEKEKDVKTARIERLIQFPMKAMVKAPERYFGQLLFELQRPADNTRGYFSLGGFHVLVHDTGSGMIEASVAVSALINESDVKALNIPFKDKNADSHSPDEGRKVHLPDY